MCIYKRKELLGLSDTSLVKNPPANAGDTGSIPGSGRYPGEGHGNPLQYSCLGNPMDRGDLWTIVHGVAKELDMEKKKRERERHGSDQTITITYHFVLLFNYHGVHPSLTRK